MDEILVYAFSLFGRWGVVVRKPKKKPMQDYHESKSWRVK